MPMHVHATAPSGRIPKPRRNLLTRLRVLGIVAFVLAGGVSAGRWYLTRRSLTWQVRRGLEALEAADTPQKLRGALERWDAETRAAWEPRLEEFITLLYRDYPLEDQRVRLLLTCVAGADYGDRREDWQRWYEARRRLRHGLPPFVARKETVALKPRWVAPVGLTAWFTTILPLDGQIYVASLGADFDGGPDAADGVVRVDGASGSAELWFMPPPEHRGPRDVIGIAAGDEGLFVGCHNGSVYYVDATARVLWHVHVGDPIAAPPLAVDTNLDGVTDVVVVTRAGKVLALSGHQGKTAWVASVARPAVGQTLLGATLALGPPRRIRGQAEPELIVTLPPGQIDVLSLRTGKSLWRQELAAGTVAGAICTAEPPTPGPPAYVGDRSASIWSLVNAGPNLEAVRWQALATRRDETLVAGLRTLGIEPAGGSPAAGSAEDGLAAPLILACVTGDYGGRRAGVCALAPTGQRWRLPLDGAIWGTPAVADLNADGRAEIVVASIEPRAAERRVGVITIVSPAGHAVQRVEVDAPIECSPVVADVDGDGRLEVLVADQSGRLHCYSTEGYGPVEWGLYGGDSHNTRNAVNAYDYGQRLYGYQWQWRPHGELRIKD
jgi:outer membrane protein assembly factor BamB